MKPSIVTVFTLLCMATVLQVIGQTNQLTSAVARRPITHADYDGWHTIESEKLSPDGKWVAYALMPQAGDAELVVRNIASGAEFRAPIGMWPRWNSAPSLQFTSDARFVAVQTYPTKAQMDQAKKEKKKPQEMPKNGLVLLDTSNGAMTRVENATVFQLPGEAAGWIAYKRAGPPQTELVLRNLADGSERKFADVLEYSLTNDGKTLVYSVSSKIEEANGVFTVNTTSSEAPQPILTGKGICDRLTWDNEQTKLAFLAHSRLHLWSRAAGVATELTGCASGLEASDKAPIRFSRDGQRIFFGCAPVTQRNAEVESADDKAVFELWHWNDGEVQSEQKQRVETERNRTFLTVWHIPEKKLVQIADNEVQDVRPSADGRWAVGLDDRPYRRTRDYDGPYFSADVYLINTLTGERKLIVKRYRRDAVTISPDARYALYFDGQNWNTISIPEGKATNLTSHLNVKFYDEQNDIPDTPFAYGNAGWTNDGKYVLLYDRYDIWQVSPDGNAAENLTKGMGRKSRTSLRYVQLGTDRRVDPSQPLLLRAENQLTRATGFYQDFIGSPQEPRRLIFDAENYSTPVKAKNADVLLLTASTFRKDPDLLVTDPEFRQLRKVSDANPQAKDLLWGSAEMMSFRNAKGVELQGILYKPENFDPRKKYPMMVYIYERLSDRLHDFNPPRPEWGHAINISYYVSNGYLVLAPDIVYTTGHPGESALNCVLSAVDTVAKQGFVDENAMGIQGHSWGGAEVAYIITHTNRFRAAEAGAIVVNMISRYDGLAYGEPSQWTYEKNQSRIGGSLWQFPELFIENSPIFAADRVKTPLMILHNDADPNAPFSGGLEFYLALRRLGKEVYLFNYNGEHHDLDKWVNQKDYAMRMQQFFDHYLKGGPKPDWIDHGIPYTRSH